MRFVPPKSPEQLAIQALHRIRQRLVRSRTKLVNQIRGILAEHGIVIARDIWRLRRALAEITGHVTDDLNTLVRVLIMEVQAELMELDQWSSVRCVAGACTEAAVKWRTTPIVRH